MTRLRVRDIREYAGVLVSVIMVLAFAAIGFAVVTAKVFLNIDVVFPDNWTISMLSLANMFAGYLIGKQTSGAMQPTLIPVPSPSVEETTSTVVSSRVTETTKQPTVDTDAEQQS